MATSSSPAPSFAIGIDFGTTFCCVAVLRHPNQNPEVIQSDVGKNTTPSYVTYNLHEDSDQESDEDERDVYAGEAAKDVAPQNPEFTIFDVKRLIGRSFYDPYIQKYQQFWPFHLVNVTGLVGVKVGNEKLLPQVIAKELISHLKKTAENYLGGPINSAVVTIPVYYNDMQKDLTRGACEDAGFTSVHFLAEPVAAAIAYGLQNSLQSHETKTCLIFDLGGGTFDVIVFKLDSNKRVEIKASGGDDRLGGEDFNDLLTEYCLEEFRKKYGINLAEGKTSSNEQVRRKTAKRLRRIRHECERQKCFLTTTPEVVISVEGVHGKYQLVVPVTRKVFEDLIEPLLKKAIRILDETLVKSGCQKGEIDAVVLIGGSSRIPKVQRMVNDYFGGRQPLHKSIDADEAVASGAAIYAYNIFHKDSAPFTMVPSVIPVVDGISANSLTFPPLQKTPKPTTVPSTHNHVKPVHSQPSTPEGPGQNVYEQLDARMFITLMRLISMGFSNHDDWLARLVVSKNGDLDEVLSALFPGAAAGAEAVADISAKSSPISTPTPLTSSTANPVLTRPIITATKNLSHRQTAEQSNTKAPANVILPLPSLPNYLQELMNGVPNAIFPALLNTTKAMVVPPSTPNLTKSADHLRPSSTLSKHSGQSNVQEKLDARMSMTLIQLISMGYSNHDEWLARLVVSKNGDLDAVLTALHPSKQT